MNQYQIKVIFLIDEIFDLKRQWKTWPSPVYVERVIENVRPT